MDRARYILALLAVVPLPAALIFWFLGHPFVRYWRRVGPRVAYAALGSVFLGACTVAWVFRAPLLGRDLGTQPILFVPAALAYAAALGVQIKIRKQCTFKVLAGLPEFAPDRAPGELFTEGMYGRVRHPRYLAVLLGYLAFALFCNYVGLYVMALVAAAGLVAIIRLEERELRERFGDRHARYCDTVPMLIPRRQR